MKQSRIIQGLMRTEKISEEQLYELIKFDLSNGIYFFDTADIYERGKSETKLGNVLKKHPELRTQMFIQSKGSIRFSSRGGYYDLSYQHIKDAVYDSLDRLSLDYLDSYLLHRPDIFVNSKEVSKAFNELYQEGKVKHFGVSNFPKSLIDYLKREVKQPLEYEQIQLGLGHTLLIDEEFNFNNDNVGAISKTDDIYFYLKDNNIIVQAWSPYTVGYFEGSLFDKEKYPKINETLEKFANKYHTSKCAIATAFILNLDENIRVITGSLDMNHIKESLDGESIQLDKEDWYAIYKECGHTLP